MACESRPKIGYIKNIIDLSAMGGIALWLLTVIFSQPALASDPSALCDLAALKASAKTGVPISVLKAISLTETGRKQTGKFRPWPWTVNMEGKGVWFDDSDSAKTYVYKNYKRGARSFDVGCFQLNYKWHGRNFASIDEMFQPDANALYAAGFLLDLYHELGDWSAAAGAYHSRTKKYSDRYRKRFDRLRTAFLDQDGVAAPLTALIARAAVTPKPAAHVLKQVALQVNHYPFLQTGQGGRGLGSLVPFSNFQRQSLFVRSPAKVDG